MNPFDIAFAAWLGYLSSIGFEAEHHLNPGTTQSLLEQVEAEIGFELPDDLKQLYMLGNGQKNIRPRDAMRRKVMKDGSEFAYWDVDPAPGTHLASLFGGFEFVSFERAIEHYRERIDWMKHDDEYSNDFVTVRDGDSVDRVYWKPGWFPFAEDGGGNSYAVDLDPPRGGTIGQVILFGPDEDERRVMGSSLSEWIQQAAENLSNFPEFAQLEYDELSPIVYFNMEWNYVPPERPVYPVDAELEMQQQRQIEEWNQFNEEFRRWLTDQQLSDTQLDAVISNAMRGSKRFSMNQREDRFNDANFSHFLNYQITRLHEDSKMDTDSIQSTLFSTRKLFQFYHYRGEWSQRQLEDSESLLKTLKVLTEERKINYPWFSGKGWGFNFWQRGEHRSIEELRSDLIQRESDFRIFLQITHSVNRFTDVTGTDTVIELTPEIENIFLQGAESAQLIMDQNVRKEAIDYLGFVAQENNWTVLSDQLKRMMVNSR